MIAATLAALAAALQVQAAPVDPVEARYSRAYDRCLASGQAAKGVTPAMVDCIGAEWELQDKGLNRTYQRVLAGLRAEQRPKLRTAQRAWIVYRNAKCDSENQTGGSIDKIGWVSCVLHETVRRTMELEEMAETAR